MRNDGANLENLDGGFSDHPSVCQLHAYGHSDSGRCKWASGKGEKHVNE